MAGDLVFLHGQRLPRCAAIVDKTFDDYCALQMVGRGVVSLAYDGRPIDVRGPAFFSCFPGPRVRFGPGRAGRTWHHRYVAFRGPIVSRWVAAGLFPVLPMPVADGPGWGRTFDDLLTRMRQGGRLGQLRAVNLLEQMLIGLAEAREAAGPVEQAAWLRAAKAGLEAGFAPDYAALAARLGMGLSTLRRRFRAATGMSVHAYVMQHRVAAARALLGETDTPIKRIAEDLGYRDVYFFTRQFKARTGVTPGAYRAARVG